MRRTLCILALGAGLWAAGTAVKAGRLKVELHPWYAAKGISAGAEADAPKPN